MKHYVEKISNLINSENIRHEIHSFNSGAYMIDVWISDNFYCIQLFDNKFGLSKVDEDTGFDTIPDKTFSKWEIFEKELKEVVNQ